MKGIKRKIVDENKQVEEKIKNETSNASEFSEEDDDKTITFAEILHEDVFDKVKGDYNESKEGNDVRENGKRQRREDGKSHDQKSESSGKDKEDGEKTSSKKESSTKNESKENDQKEVTHFKHGTPKEISIFVTAKVTTLPYENIDISTGITLTLPPNADHTTAVLARAEAYEYCEAFIAEKVTEIRKSLAGVKK